MSPPNILTSTWIKNEYYLHSYRVEVRNNIKADKILSIVSGMY